MAVTLDDEKILGKLQSAHTNSSLFLLQTLARSSKAVQFPSSLTFIVKIQPLLRLRLKSTVSQLVKMSLTTSSRNFQAIDTKYAIEGAIENIAPLKANYKSVLYLCPDSATDKGAIDGVNTVLEHFDHAHVKHVPFDSCKPEFQVGTSASPLLSLQTYKKFEEALDSLPTPTVIVCKSSRRASAVLTAYQVVKGLWTKEQAQQIAIDKGFGYLQSDGMAEWVNTVIDNLVGLHPLLLRQLFERESSTYTYLLADTVTKEAILIDPVLETAQRDAQLVSELGLTLKYAINTHVHADHITGTGALKKVFPETLSAISSLGGAEADVQLLCSGTSSEKNGNTLLQFGNRKIYAVSTPGHTAGCTSYILDDLSAVFTGDALLIRGCGRTDFQGGSANELYHSVHDKLYLLPDSCKVFPAHDYKGLPNSSIGEEKKLNPRLTKTEDEFVAIMGGLNLPKPKQIDRSVPANLKCGVFEE